MAPPKLVPTRNTFAPNKGLPVTVSLTAPVIVAPFTDEIRGPNNSKHKDRAIGCLFIYLKMGEIFFFQPIDMQ